MERRFVREWSDIEARVDGGETLPDVIRGYRTDKLVAALASAGGTNPVAANVIATEVLNRLHRAPYLGAVIASATTVIVLVVSDLFFTGWPLFSTATGRTYAVLAFSAFATVFSAFMWLMWRGRFRRLRLLLMRRRERTF